MKNAITWKDLSDKLLYEFSSEDELLKAIKELHRIFIERRGLGSYVNDSRLVSAYAGFYFPTNLQKLQFLFSQLSKDILNDLFEHEFIDFGCGPGTFSFALTKISEKRPKKIILFDKSSLMLDQAKRFLPEDDVQRADSIEDLPKGQVLFVGNCLNEMPMPEILNLLDKLNPRMLIFIEPGTKEFFAKGLKIRDEMKRRGLHNLYPCPSLEACPMLGHDNWCHQVVRAKYDISIERLSQKLELDRRNLPMIAHVYHNEIKSLGQDRLIRLNKETKHSLIFDVCKYQDDKNQYLREEIQTTKLKKKQVKELKKVAWGTEFKKDL